MKIPLAFLFALVLIGAFAGFFASDPARLGLIAAYDVESHALTAIRAGDTETGRQMLSTLTEGLNSLSPPAENVAESLLNLGNIAYGSGNFTQARDYYARSRPMRIEGEFRRLHNLGNTEYRLGEAERDDASRILMWGSAVERYEAALAWREDRETRENLEFVKKKLQDMQEQQKQEQTASNRPSGSGARSSGSGSESGGQGSSGERIPQSGGIWRNTGEFDRVGGSDGGEQSLSDSERAGLEQRMRSIDELNKSGQEYLRRDGTPRQGQDGSFFGTIPFFEDSPGSVEKDW